LAIILYTRVHSILMVNFEPRWLLWTAARTRFSRKITHNWGAAPLTGGRSGHKPFQLSALVRASFGPKDVSICEVVSEIKAKNGTFSLRAETTKNLKSGLLGGLGTCHLGTKNLTPIRRVEKVLSPIGSLFGYFLLPKPSRTQNFGAAWRPTDPS
jgi:hypothetical protein